MSASQFGGAVNFQAREVAYSAEDAEDGEVGAPKRYGD